MRGLVAAEEHGGYAAPSPAPGLLDAVSSARESVVAALGVPTDGVGASVLAHTLDEVVRLKRAAVALEAKVVRAVDRAGVAGEAGAADTVALLKQRGQLSGREAKRAVELGRQLERLPQTAAALGSGDVGVEQAEQVARAARTGRLGMPKLVESQLLESAKSSSPEQLRDEVKRRELDADGDRLLKDEKLAHSRRSLRTWRDDDGMGRGTWALSPVAHEFVETMIRAFTTFDGPDTPQELRRSPEQRAADALVQAAKVALDAGEAPDCNGEKPHVSVVVTAEALAGDRSAPPAETAWGGPIAFESLQRLVCDARLTRILATGESQLLDVGRATRAWSGSQRRGIVAIDGGCRFPGCDRPAAWTNIHHVAFWERDEGPTDVDNGVLLCVLHHHLCHEGGWTLTMDPDTRVVTVVSPNRRTRLTSRPRGLIPRTARRRRRPPS